MAIKTQKLKLKSEKQFELIDITEKVASIVQSSKVEDGIVLVFAPHTTASIRIAKNESLLIQDFMKMIYRLVPIDMNYSHDMYEIRAGMKLDERSNGHAHVKSFLLGASATIPVNGGEMSLSQRQSIFFVELDGARTREVIVQVVGE